MILITDHSKMTFSVLAFPVRCVKASQNFSSYSERKIYLHESLPFLEEPFVEKSKCSDLRYSDFLRWCTSQASHNVTESSIYREKSVGALSYLLVIGLVVINTEGERASRNSLSFGMKEETFVYSPFLGEKSNRTISLSAVITF